MRRNNIITSKTKGVIILSLFGFIFNVNAQTPNINKIKQELKENKAVLIDVREDSEVRDGKIEHAIHIPLGLLKTSENIAKIKNMSRKKKIYFYCRSGTRSQKAIDMLQKYDIKSENAGGYEVLHKSGL
jgi:rhodanese-related sulfurtransferase